MKGISFWMLLNIAVFLDLYSILLLHDLRFHMQWILCVNLWVHHRPPILLLLSVFYGMLLAHFIMSLYYSTPSSHLTLTPYSDADWGRKTSWKGPPLPTACPLLAWLTTALASFLYEDPLRTGTFPARKMEPNALGWIDSKENYNSIEGNRCISTLIQGKGNMLLP